MPDTLKIGEWVIKPASGQVLKDDKEHRLEPKAMAVLVYLAENAGEIVSRNELEESVWHGSVVTYEALTVTINKIRAAFEDDSRKPRYVETLAKRGYRLIAPISNNETLPQSFRLDTKNSFNNKLIIIAAVIFAFIVIYYQSTNIYQIHDDLNRTLCFHIYSHPYHFSHIL